MQMIYDDVRKLLMMGAAMQRSVSLMSGVVGRDVTSLHHRMM